MSINVPSYLSKSRHGVYYVRFATPRALKSACPYLPSEIRKSLHTRCLREAAVRSRKLALDFRILMTEALDAMTPKNNDSGQFLVTRDADGRISYKFDETDTPEKVKEYIQLLQATGQLPFDATPLQRAVAVPSDTELHDLRMEAKSMKAGGMWLSELVQAYADEKLISEWTSNTWIQTYKPLLRDFRELVSKSKRTTTDEDGREIEIWDIYARELDEEHIQIYTNAMYKFPKNYGSMKSLGDAKQALNAGLPSQSRENAFKKIRMVKTFLTWAYKKRKLSEQLDVLLPTEKKDKKRDRSKDGYQPWSDSELKKIFERETYPADGYKFWTPLIALYTGARANEIAQLHVSDVIKTESGIDCISIMDLGDDADDDEPVATPDTVNIKSVKTASSRRWVPIHPKLIDAGFLKFVDYMRDKKEVRLFPELKYSEIGGYGRNVSRSFAEVSKRLAIWVERKKVFHSFRSTFNGRLMKLGTSQEMREFLLGHANESMNVQAYGKQIQDRPYQQLYEEVKRVDFDLTHKVWEPVFDLPAL